MVTGDIQHELGRVGGLLDALRRGFDEEREHTRRSEERFGKALEELTLLQREAVAEGKKTNGRVDRLEDWRATVDPQLAAQRAAVKDAAAVRRWWHTLRGRVGIGFTIVSVAVGGVLQVAAAIHNLWG